MKKKLNDYNHWIPALKRWLPDHHAPNIPYFREILHFLDLFRPMTTKPSKALETFPNPAPHRDYQIHMEIPEFTCLCPKTGQPDFAVLTLDYIADKLCVELKSLKLYVWSFRDEGHFHEAVTNRMLDDLVKALKPRYMRLTARFYVRGGVFTNVVAEHRKKGWKPAPRVELDEFSTQPSIGNIR